MSTESEQISSPIYDIWEKDAIDISTDSLQYLEFFDVNLNDANSVRDYRIEVKERENFLLLNKGYINVRFKLQTTGGADHAGNGAVVTALQNNAVGLFQRLELLLDDNVIESVEAQILNTVQNLVCI